MAARAMTTVAGRPKVHVDVTSDTVCPWCFVGKKNLEAAIKACEEKIDVEVQWHPFLLNPSAPREGVNKIEYYKSKFGASRVPVMMERMASIFSSLGYTYRMGGLTGNTFDSHRLLDYAGRKSFKIQNDLAEELFLDYFTREKYVGDKEVLLDAAKRVGLEGAEEFLNNPTAGVKEVEEGLRSFARGVSGVPHFRIGGLEISGAQPPEVLVEALGKATR